MKNPSQVTIQEIKSKLPISDVLKHYGGECTNQASGAWWCIMHETKGKSKTPSLVAKDSTGTASCLSRGCFKGDDIFGVIAKMENLNIKNDFAEVKKRACSIGGISTESYIETQNNRKNAIPKKMTIDELQTKHIKYLENIGISKETGDFFNLKSRYDYILYPQIKNKAIVGYKGISIHKDSQTSKSKMFFEGTKVSIWGNTQDTEGKHIIFVEGEKDCMRLTEEIRQIKKDSSYTALTTTTGAKTIPTDLLDKIKKYKPQKISIIYDNDKTGNEGSKKLAKTLTEMISKVDVYYFNSNNKEGYDITDFLNEGREFDDIWELESEVFRKEAKTLQSSYPYYIVNENSILDTLAPDKVLYTGYKEIDEQCPVVVGENSIIVGRTGKGKTVLGVNFVNGILKNNENSKVVVFSLELKKKAI